MQTQTEQKVRGEQSERRWRVSHCSKMKWHYFTMLQTQVMEIKRNKENYNYILLAPFVQLILKKMYAEEMFSVLELC